MNTGQEQAWFTGQELAKVPGIRHGFGSALAPIADPFLKDWPETSPRWKQVHGDRCVEVRARQQVCGETDALCTAQTGLPVGVVTADCVPILLAHADGGHVAAIHAGWRGTIARIVRHTWDSFPKDWPRRDWVAAIGPAIGPCCYEVSEELAARFASDFSNLHPAEILPRRRHLDLQAVNRQELTALGIQKIDVLRLCTRCQETTAAGENPVKKPLFHSFRRDGAGTRQWSIIEILAK
ncbi:MAG: peptidoglycan editing factor PgeF [Bacteriovoracia bacterium]